MVEPKRKILTRRETDKKREYWKEKQRQSRAKRSSQKIRRKKEKDREYVKKKRIITEVQETCRTESSPKKMSQSAVRKAVQRANLPKDAENFAETMEYIISASPNKRPALEEKGVISTKKHNCNERIVDILKEKLKNRKMKKSLLPALVMKKYKMMKTTSLNLGIHPSDLSRCTEEPFTRKKRIDEKAEKHLVNFFQEISTPVPDRKSAKGKGEPEERKILDRPLKSVYTDYKESGGKLGFSTFAKKYPKTSKPVTNNVGTVVFASTVQM